MTTYLDVVPQLLDIIPELNQNYDKMNEGFGSKFSAAEIEELDKLDESLRLPKVKQRSIGTTIVFENLLVPYIVSLATSEDWTVLSKIMDWIEVLANGIFEVSNLVAGSVCEPIIASNGNSILTIYPYMGKRTREFCKMQFSRFMVSDEVKQLFHEVRG